MVTPVDSADHTDPADHTAEAFLGAISNRPSLAHLVQSLSIGIGRYAPDERAVPHNVDIIRDHCKRCVEILSACVKLDHLVVFGFAPPAKDTLIESIKRHIQLRTLAFGEPWYGRKVPLAEFLLEEYQALVETCHSLEVLGLRSGYRSPSSSPWLTFANNVRQLELDSIAMSDGQFGALMERIAPTLQALSISYEVSITTYGSSWPSYPAVCEALGFLQQLEHLHLDIQQDCVGFDRDITSPWLLSACKKLKTVYISPDTFPFTGLGHLASPQLRTFHFWVSSGAFTPPLDVEGLSAGIEAMLLSPQTCPRTLSVAHQIVVIDEAEAEDDFEPGNPQDERLEGDFVSELESACRAVGVEFLYKVFWR